jgi:hypothetical protein
MGDAFARRARNVGGRFPNALQRNSFRRRLTMSWSFNAIGKPAAVAIKARADLANFKCAEPEESIKAGIIDMIEKACAAMPSTAAVKIEAFGSQSPSYPPEPGKFHNNFSVKVEPIYGFVE